jgi:hypothetical protein
MESKNQNDLLTYQYTFQMIASLAIFVATAATLWKHEADVVCLAPYH